MLTKALVGARLDDEARSLGVERHHGRHAAVNAVRAVVVAGELELVAGAKLLPYLRPASRRPGSQPRKRLKKRMSLE